MRTLVLVSVLSVAACTVGCAASTKTTATSVDSAPRIETGALNEAVIGSRVSMRGRVTRVQDDAPYGHKLWLDDGTGEAQVFIDATTELIRHTGAWRVDDELFVTGNVAKYQELWELLPKLASDIVVVDRPSD